jgi:hypothetical protein
MIATKTIPTPTCFSDATIAAHTTTERTKSIICVGITASVAFLTDFVIAVVANNHIAIVQRMSLSDSVPFVAVFAFEVQNRMALVAEITIVISEICPTSTNDADVRFAVFIVRHGFYLFSFWF